MSAQLDTAWINASPVHKSRRSRSEGLLRYLMASSYPHAMAASLSYGLAKNVLGDSERQKLAGDLKQLERDIPLDAFFRCIEITRNRQGVSVVPKVLALDKINGRVDDNPRNHIPWSEVKFDIDADISLSFDKKDLLKILKATVTTIAPDVPFDTPLEKLKWTCYHPVVSAEGTTITDLVVKHQRSQVETNSVVEHLQKIFAGHTFKVFFTPKTIVTKVLGSATTFKFPQVK